MHLITSWKTRFRTEQLLCQTKNPSSVCISSVPWDWILQHLIRYELHLQLFPPQNLQLLFSLSSQSPAAKRILQVTLSSTEICSLEAVLGASGLAESVIPLSNVFEIEEGVQKITAGNTQKRQSRLPQSLYQEKQDSLSFPALEKADFHIKAIFI